VNNADRSTSAATSSTSAANWLLGAAALALVGAGAGGWVAYHQMDPLIQFIALTLAFASVLASIALAMLALGDAQAAVEPPRHTDTCSMGRERRWNGTGSPRSSGGHLLGPHDTIDRHWPV
jgi:hypothetical protein